MRAFLTRRFDVGDQGDDLYRFAQTCMRSVSSESRMRPSFQYAPISSAKMQDVFFSHRRLSQLTPSNW